MKISLYYHWRLILHRCRHGIRFLIGKHLKPRETALSAKPWQAGMQICPRCGELVYHRQMCIMCGQRFKGNVKTVGEVMDRAGC